MSQSVSVLENFSKEFQDDVALDVEKQYVVDLMEGGVSPYEMIEHLINSNKANRAQVRKAVALLTGDNGGD